MLRRSSILFICFLLFLALFALTAEGQDTYHIGIPQTLEDGSPNPAYKPNGQHEGNNYYFASLQSLKADIIRYSVIQQSGDSIELRLYSDQIIPNPSESADDFYHIGSEPSTPEYSTPKTVRITSGDGKPKDIKTSDGVPVDAGFLHIDSSVGTQKVNLIIDKNISIRAGSATEPDRYATHISGGDFIAQGVTYQEGGQIYVTNAGNNRS
ncbi:MAG: hypothetical protein LBI18_06200, partial [Planctomycetaceae bacterium]|nr:hypothetical protein [Planctomycetaceae bacterium]